jgi:hypothetical protein
MILQASVGLGGLFTVLSFYLIKDWKIIFFTFQFVPFVGCLLFTYFFLQETPQFLVK